jgi:hypothetical protein
MRRVVPIILLGFLLSPAPANAKRTPAPAVEPVVYQGVKYVVPNDRGTRGYVEAWDTATGKRLWEKTVFRTWICPLLEHDVQWVFTKRMWREGARLILVSERSKTYALDLKTRKVRRITSKPAPARRVGSSGGTLPRAGSLRRSSMTPWPGSPAFLLMAGLWRLRPAGAGWSSYAPPRSLRWTRSRW